MATDTITYSSVLTVVDCCACGILFGVPVDLDKRNRNDHSRSFYCPSGHGQHYTGPTEAQRLRAQLETAERQRDNAESARIAARDQARSAERSASAYKGRVTRLKNRAAAGVCPCCQRTFQQLARHMSAKHPDFRDSDGEPGATQ
jgi:hypothetical protein